MASGGWSHDGRGHPYNQSINRVRGGRAGALCGSPYDESESTGSVNELIAAKATAGLLSITAAASQRQCGHAASM